MQLISLADACGDYVCFGKATFYVKCFEMEQRAVIKLCVKLKKTPTETFKMLTSAYVEKCLSRPSVFEWHSVFREGQEFFQNKRIDGNLSEVFDLISEFESLDVRRNDRD